MMTLKTDHPTNPLPRIAILAHSENPPLEILTPLLQRLGFAPHVVRVPYGEELPDPATLRGLIILGAPMSVYNHPDLEWLQQEIGFVNSCLSRRLPIFGICFGCQLLAYVHGADVFEGRCGREFGLGPIELLPHADPVFGQELASVPRVFHAHRDTFSLPEGALQLMSNANYCNQAVRFGERVYGVQWHPEITGAVARRWHESGLERGSTYPNLPLPKDHAAEVNTAMPPIHAWLEGFCARLFKA